MYTILSLTNCREGSRIKTQRVSEVGSMKHLETVSYRQYTHSRYLIKYMLLLYTVKTKVLIISKNMSVTVKYAHQLLRCIKK